MILFLMKMSLTYAKLFLVLSQVEHETHNDIIMTSPKSYF